MPYIREGNCVYKKNPDGSKGKKEGCSENEEKAKAYMRALYAAESKSMAEFSMVITKASIPDKKSRTMRLSMVTSDTGEDAYEERMSTELFTDFVQRIDTLSPVPEPFNAVLQDGDWKGGMPYPSISHYKSGNGVNVPGEIERVYVDGEKLKANAILHDSPLGMAVWKSVCQDIDDREKPLEEKAFVNPVRISIGFLDLEHKHEVEDGEDFIFTRSDLGQRCEMCEKGINGKVYLKGQLVHLAFTRVPANPRTSVEVLRMDADEIIKTKKDDAKSIIGDLAEELVGKSTVEDDVLVVKDDMKDVCDEDEEDAVEDEVEVVEEAMSKREDVSPSDKKRAEKKYGDVKYADEKNKKYPIDTEEHIRAAWNYIGQKKNQAKYSASEVASIKNKIIAAWKAKIDKAGPPSAQQSKSEVIMDEELVQEETPVVEEEKSALDLAFETLKAKIAESKGKGTAAYADLQPLLNQFGNTVKSEVANPSEMNAEVTRAAIKEEIAAAIPEIVAQIMKSIPTQQPVQQKSQEVPVSRSLFLNQANVQPTKEMSQIEKIAFNSSVGTVTGQKVD